MQVTAMRMHILQHMVVVIFLSVSTAHADALPEELSALEGRWELVSVEYGRETSTIERDEAAWVIEGDQLVVFENSKKVDSVRIEINPNAEPKRIDLVPVGDPEPTDDPDIERQRILTRTKCLYLLSGDQLSIAITFEFSPGTLEAERQRAIEYAKKRPVSFDTTKGDVAVLSFERAKKK